MVVVLIFLCALTHRSAYLGPERRSARLLKERSGGVLWREDTAHLGFAGLIVADPVHAHLERERPPGV